MARRPTSAAPGGGALESPDVAGRKPVFLQSGQVVAAAAPTAITTVLGSCIAVCLHDPVARVGGMNHFLLPYHVERERSPRFGNVAVPELVRAVVRAGAAQERLVAKVFGGACVLGEPASRGRHLGEENAAVALELLAGLGIRVLDKDVGGTRGRKLVFATDEGVAWVRAL